MNEELKKYMEFVNNPNLNFENEVWNEHPIHKGYYASNFGRLKYYNKQQKKEIIKKQYARQITNRLVITIYNTHFECKTLYVPKFILECFYGLNEDLFTLHIDGNYYNNNIENLAYATKKEISGNPNIKRKKRKYNKQKENIEEIIQNETWKKHPTLEIECSDKGRIKKKRKNQSYDITYGSKTIDGYLRIQINNKSYAVHRLICETFIENPNNKLFVNHIDANPSNNKIENLEWCTAKENCMSEITYKKQAHQIKSIDDNGIETIYKSLKDAYRHGFDEYRIIKCCQGLQSKHKGLKWQYV